MSNPFEQARIHQLISDYSPDTPPTLTLDFGDYLSLLWRLDQLAAHTGQAQYYRRCAHALGQGLGLEGQPVYKLVEYSESGSLYVQLPNVAYRFAPRLLDASDRRAAAAQLLSLRQDILRVGSASAQWGAGWPGSGIDDEELRERVFAVLFTALQGQFANFGRLLLVIDIVLANLLVGMETLPELPLSELVMNFGYPHPKDPNVRQQFYENPPPS